MYTPKHENPIDILGEAYERLYERTAESLKKLNNLNDIDLPKVIEEAKNKAIELEELTEENALKVSQWLQRDLDDAVKYLADSNNEIKDWLGFETSLLESELFSMFLDVADKTTVELQQFKNNAEVHPKYHTGEISGPGTLTCNECGEKLHFYKTGKIPPCPKCHGTVFHRSTSEL